MTECTQNLSPDADSVISERKAKSRHNIHEYTVGEEVANSITHGIGAGLAIAAIPITIVKAVADGGGILLFVGLMYTIIMLLEYLMSTLYHALAPAPAKRVFKVLDHSFIYLYIAASYTPFCLVTLSDVGGWWLFWLVWILAIIGVLFEAFWVFRPRWISAVLYVAMGWTVIWFLPYLISVLPPLALWLLVIGGLCYTVGAILYVLKKVKFMHSVFHLFVLAGSCFQFFSIFFFVI